MCCFSTGKVVSAPSWVEGKLYKLFHSPQIFRSSSSSSILQLKRSSRHHPFTLTPYTSYKKHSISLLLPPSRLQILIKSIKMHFTKAFTFTAIVLAGAAFAAPSPSKPTKPVAPTINDQSQTNTCGSGSTTYCCNGGDGSTKNLGTCQAQGNLPLSKGVSWASIFLVIRTLSYQPAKNVLVLAGACNSDSTIICCQATNVSIR